MWGLSPRGGGPEVLEIGSSHRPGRSVREGCPRQQPSASGKVHQHLLERTPLHHTMPFLSASRASPSTEADRGHVTELPLPPSSLQATLCTPPPRLHAALAHGLRRESPGLWEAPLDLPGLGGERAFSQTPQPLSCRSRLLSSAPLTSAQEGLRPVRWPRWLLLHRPQEGDGPGSARDTPLSHVTRLGRLPPSPEVTPH